MFLLRFTKGEDSWWPFVLVLGLIRTVTVTFVTITEKKLAMLFI